MGMEVGEPVEVTVAVARAAARAAAMVEVREVVKLVAMGEVEKAAR